MNPFYSTIIMNTLKSLFEWENTGTDFKFSLNLSKDEKKLIKKMTMGKEIRLRLHIDKSRIWNMGMKNAKKHSYMTWSDSIVKGSLNRTGTEKDLSTMTIFQKSVYLRNYSKVVHRTNHNDVFYYNYNKGDTVLFHALTPKFLFYRGEIERSFVPRGKIERYLCQSFTSTEIQLIFLKNFNL